MEHDDLEIPEPQRPVVDSVHFEQMQVLLEQLVTRVVTLENRVAEMTRTVDHGGEPEAAEGCPAPWVLYPPPSVTGGDQFAEVRAFVDYYNTIYVGRSDGRAHRIPACWEEHPGLAMEIANLAASWRGANIGPDASCREAQFWHHQWRPGAIDRMVRDWVHPDCLDGSHKTVGRNGLEASS